MSSTVSQSTGKILPDGGDGGQRVSSWRRLGSIIANTFKSLVNRKRLRTDDERTPEEHSRPTTRRRQSPDRCGYHLSQERRELSVKPDRRLLHTSPDNDTIWDNYRGRRLSTDNGGGLLDIEACLPSYHLYRDTFPGPAAVTLDSALCRQLSLGSFPIPKRGMSLTRRRRSDPALTLPSSMDEDEWRRRVDDLQMHNDILTSACLHSLQFNDVNDHHHSMVTVERRPRVRFSSGIKEIISKKDPWLPRGPDIHPAIEYTTAPRPAEQIKPSREYTLDEYRQAAEHSAASEGYIVKMDEFEKKKNGLQQQYDELRSRELSLRKETDKRAPEVAVEADRGVSRRPLWMVLTDEERMDGRALLCRTGSELLAPKQYNIDITAHALSCLQQGRWLNDEVVNYYFMMLQDRSDRSCKGSLPRVFLWNSFFWQKLSSNASGAYSYKSVARWSKRRHADIFSYDMMIVPIHVGKTHWALGVVDLKECTLSYYDSLGASHPKFYDYISRYIEDEHKDKGSKAPLRNPSGWQRRDAVITPTCTVPRQNNSNDCGVFMCMFAEAVSGGRSITEVSQDIIVDMRYKMACQISAGRVPGPTD